MKPPFVAVRALPNDEKVSELLGSLAPAKMVPIATDPDVLVPTEGSHAIVHLRGRCEAYVCAREALLVPDHFVGVIGSMRLRPAGCDVTGNISLVLSDADPSLVFLNVAYDVVVRVYATGAVLLVELVFRVCFFGTDLTVERLCFGDMVLCECRRSQSNLRYMT